MHFIIQKKSSQKLMIPICIVHSLVYLIIFSSSDLIAYPAKKDVDAYFRKVKQQLEVASDGSSFRNMLFEDYNNFCKSHGLEPLSGKTTTFQNLHYILLHLLYLRAEAIEREIGGVSFQEVGDKLRSLVERLEGYIKYIGFNYAYGTLFSRDIVLNEEATRSTLQRDKVAMMGCVATYNELRELLGQPKVLSFGELDLEWVTDVLDYLYEKKIDTCVKHLGTKEREEFIRSVARQRFAFEPMASGMHSLSMDAKMRKLFISSLNEKNICALAGFPLDLVDHDSDDESIFNAVLNYIVRKLKLVEEVVSPTSILVNLFIQAGNNMERAQFRPESKTLKSKDEL